MQTIAEFLKFATTSLVEACENPHLESEIILAAILKKSRAFLYSHPENEISTEDLKTCLTFLTRRQQGEPLPYITGEQEFWSLTLSVNSDTLIPRADTELLVEKVLENSTSHQKTTGTAGTTKILDLGTGSGAIALALAYERPTWQIFATDKCEKALNMAKANAKRLHLKNIQFFLGEWYKAVPNEKFDIIVSNPPYISEFDQAIQESVQVFEPKKALFSAENGLKDLKHIIQQATLYLKTNGKVFLEHGYQQAADVQEFFLRFGYRNIQTWQDLGNCDRVTSAEIY